MKLRTLIIEDNPKYMAALSEYVSVLDAIDLVGSANNKEDGIDLIKKVMPDLVLLDIELPHEGEGFQILQSIGDDITFDIIIITAHAKSDYVNKYGDINSRLEDSIVKLLYKQEFDDKPEQLGNFINKVIENRKQPNHNSKRQQEIICLKTNINSKRDDRKILCMLKDNERQAVSLKDIVYIKSDEHYQIIHIHNEKKFMIRYGLQSLEDSLKSYDFMRIHRRYVVNLTHVKRISLKNRKLFFLDDESIELPIGRHKLLEVKEKLNYIK